MKKLHSLLCDVLRSGPTHLDDLAAATGTDRSQVVKAMLDLELERKVRRLPGDKYEKTTHTAQDVADYIRRVHRLPILFVRPVRVMLLDKEYVGAFYGVEEVYEDTERATTEGPCKPGEKRPEYRFSLLGVRPKLRRGKPTFVWKHGLRLDERIEVESGEWYVSSYYEQDEPNAEYHPFGKTFTLNQWNTPTYGPYKGKGIDFGERFPYKRHSMTVEFLDEE